ncbi:hypothetical protein JXA32_16705 [Candidatus Sumerlaeota bacterium]|nr:hypothetical protein [Candidatus Sumerlaeota bacterium]
MKINMPMILCALLAAFCMCGLGFADDGDDNVRLGAGTAQEGGAQTIGGAAIGHGAHHSERPEDLDDDEQVIVLQAKLDLLQEWMDRKIQAEDLRALHDRYALELHELELRRRIASESYVATQNLSSPLPGEAAYRSAPPHIPGEARGSLGEIKKGDAVQDEFSLEMQAIIKTFSRDFPEWAELRAKLQRAAQDAPNEQAVQLKQILELAELEVQLMGSFNETGAEAYRSHGTMLTAALRNEWLACELRRQRAAEEDFSANEKALRRSLEEEFQLRQDSRGRNADELERELKALRESLERRKTHREEIIQRRMEELTGDHEDGGWKF